MPKCLNFYVDESGSRLPDRKQNEHAPRHDFFAMGGILINEEDEDFAREQHSKFCIEWKIQNPLHSVEIRHSSQNFFWLHGKNKAEKEDFYGALHKLICESAAIGLACVIDRPGYNQRYKEIYGTQRWRLCRTAFAISVERAARRAISDGRKLRVFVEACGPKEDKCVKEYYDHLRELGTPFSTATSAQYLPLTSADFHGTLYDLKFKNKSSPMMQLADLFLFPMACGGYDEKYIAYNLLKRDKKLIDCFLNEEQKKLLGIKYSCFDTQKNQPQVDPANREAVPLAQA